MLSTDSILDRAGAWFLNSGIQQANGGVSRYYRSDTATYARTSTEITGYAVSTLLYLGRRTGRNDYSEAGIRAAQFLTCIAWKDRLACFPFEHSDNCEQPEPLAYFFDTGIIVRGLLAAWQRTNQQRYLDTAVAAGRSMLDDFRAGAAHHPIIRLPLKEPVAYAPKWSASPGCYQLKAALAWRELFQQTGESRFQSAWENAVDCALQNEPAFLPGEMEREKVMDRLHAYCYFLEALLACADDSGCARRIADGIERTAAYLRDIAPAFARSDVYAQLLRVRLYAAALGIAPLDAPAAACEAARAAEFHLASDDVRIEGGFSFGRKGRDLLPFVNPVSTSFCLQALAMWSDYSSGNAPTSLEALI